MNITQTDGSLWQRRIFVITALFLVCGVLPFVGGLAVGNFFPDWQWNHVAFHSFVESFGSLMAIAIAVFILVRTDVKSRNYMLPLACSMLAMGILDGFHACVNPGVKFVWLHSTAQFAGGLFIAMMWLPKHFIRKLTVKWLPSLLAIAFVLIGVISISYPEALPAMLVNGKFTLAAKMLNIIGGVLFLSGGIYFALRFHRNGDVTSLLFSSLCLLFGVAGITFESSVLWDTGWWMWHLMRVAAYVVALGYVATRSASEYRRTIQAETTLQESEQQLKASNQQLRAGEQQLKASNQQLDASNQQLRAIEQQLRASNQQLDASNQHLRAKEQQLLSLNHNMNERVKELNGLYCLSKVIEIPNIALPEIFQRLAELLPPSWQYPQITCGRVVFNGNEFKTDDFKETQWLQSADIKVFGKKRGTIDVYYLRECPVLDEGPFLKEERDLINSLAERLSRVIEHKQAEEEKGKIIAEMERMNRLMTGREMRVIEMKKEVNALLAELGRQPEYKSVLEETEAVVSSDMRQSKHAPRQMDPAEER